MKHLIVMNKQSCILTEKGVNYMLKPGCGFASKERGIQTMHCSSCGKNLGTQGWEGQKGFNDVEEKGWKFCPYCGEPLYK